MALFRWLRWFLFRLHWRLIFVTAGYCIAPYALERQYVDPIRSACVAVMVASVGTWASHVARRNGQRPPKAGLFGARRDDER